MNAPHSAAPRSQSLSALCLGAAILHFYFVISCILSLILWPFVMPEDVVALIVEYLRGTPGVPRIIVVSFDHMYASTGAWMALSGLTGTLALGTLLRRAWARAALLPFLLIQVGIHLSIPVLTLLTLSAFVPPSMPFGFRLFTLAACAMVSVQPLLFAAGHGLLVHVLTRPENKEEFS